MADTAELLKCSHAGDKEARDRLVMENAGLVWSIVKRFAGRGTEVEDLFQIGNIGLMKEESYNEKKPENLIKIRNTRIVRYIVVDHCSGNFYLRYEQAAGEDAKGFLDTLIDAITDRGPQDVMHGVPEILYTDPGPGPASSLVTGFCGQIGITPAACAWKSPRHRLGRKVSGHRRMQVREPPALSGSA